MEGKRRLTVLVTGANGGGIMVRSRNLRGRLHDRLGKKQGGGRGEDDRLLDIYVSVLLKNPVLTASSAVITQVQQSQKWSLSR